MDGGALQCRDPKLYDFERRHQESAHSMRQKLTRGSASVCLPREQERCYVDRTGLRFSGARICLVPGEQQLLRRAVLGYNHPRPL
jgi:hypothetical protein